MGHHCHGPEEERAIGLEASRRGCHREDHTRRGPSACGVRPWRGWSVDLFVENKCARCMRKLGIDCKKCRGKGFTGRASTNNWKPCYACAFTGEAR